MAQLRWVMPALAAPPPPARRLRRWLALALVALVLLLTLPWRRPAPTPAAPPAWFEALPPGDAPRGALGAGARKLTLAGVTRNAVPAAGALELSLAPPPGATLELSAGLRCAEGAVCRGAVDFELLAGGRSLGGQRLTAGWREDHPEALPLQGPATTWRAWRVPLPPAGGRLTLRATAAPGPVPPGAEAPTPFWGEPLLLVPPAGQRNVVLLSIDTLRADRLGSYGYRRHATSPHLDRLAAEGLRFEQAVAPSPWTTPSHMSLMTGLYPSTHRVNTQVEKTPARRLAPGVPTLAGRLRERGWHTRAYTGGGTMGAALGFDQGFDVYEHGPLKLTPRARQEMLARLHELREVPFFLYLHTFEVHAPYTRTRWVEPRLSAAARADWQSRFDLEWLPRPAQRALSDQAPLEGPAGQLTPAQRARRLALKDEGLPRLLGRHGLWDADSASDLYDGGVREADDFVGELLAELERLGLADRTAVVVTSDHGEEFGEHDPTRFWDAHCSTLYDEVLRVPLLLRLPGGPSGVVARQVELLDVAPTLLAWLGLPPQPGLQGRDLLRLAPGGADTGAADWALSEATCADPERKALRRPDLKYVVELGGAGGDDSQAPRLARHELYELDRDPGERRDLAPARAAQVARLAEELLARVARLRAAGRQAPQAQAPRDAETLERLRALGYVQ